MAASFFRTNILRRAWAMTWANKRLWFFGLFAAVLAIGEEYDLLVRNSDILGTVQSRLEQLRFLQQQGAVATVWHQLTQTIQANIGGSITVLLTWVLALGAVAWLVIVSQAALIEAARKHEEGRHLSLLGGFDIGMFSFWRIFGLNIVAKLIVYGALYVVVIPLALLYLRTSATGLGVAITLWTFIVLFPLITIVAFVTKYAMSYIVLKGQRVGAAIGAAWRLFTRNWLVTIELALILILINFVVIYSATATLVSALNFPQVSTLGYLTFIVALGFVFAWLTTFQFAAWTNLFLRLDAGTAPSKLQRILNYLLDIRERTTKPAAVRARRSA